MLVNSEKTKMLAITANNHEKISTYINLPDGQTVKSQETLKILGFVFGRRPNVSDHIEHLSELFRKRVWILRHLKNAGLNSKDLTKLCQVLILPTLDYASNVYHSQLTQEQTNHLEKLQIRALKIIYGFHYLATELLELSGVEHLWTRRERLMDKFIDKLLKNEHFLNDWLPRKEFHHRDLRKELIFEEKFARTKRLYRSPKYFIRRRINKKRHAFGL